MTDTATPETAPDASAPLDIRHAHVMSLLQQEQKQAEPETEQSDQPEVEEPEADQPEVEAPEAESEDDTEPETEEPEKPASFRVKVDGEEIEVTLDELLKGYSRTEDYKRKTAKAAEERRAFESTRDSELQKIREASQRYLSDFNNASQDRLILDEANRIDWTRFAQENPNGYIAAKAKVEAAQARLNAAEQELSRSQQERIAEQMQKAAESIPEFADEKKRPEYLKRVISTLEDYGFTREEMASLNDARTLRVVHDALQFRESEAKRKAAIQTIADKRVVAKTADPTRRLASNAVTESKRSLKAQIAKTGDLRERAVLIAKYNNLYPKEKS